jgi:hypothetical protein
LPEKRPPEEIPEDVIVIDDISWITDVSAQEYVRRLMRAPVKQVVLVGRNRMPKWLSEEYVSGADIPAFDKRLVAAASLLPDVSRVLAYATQIGDIVQIERDGDYRMQRMLPRYLQWKRANVWNAAGEKALHDRPGGGRICAGRISDRLRRLYRRRRSIL